jgi:hypothetical protein
MAMASFAHLSREERAGLGIAAAAHVALGLALWLNVQDEPTPLPIPERMSVSLASEVSLQSTVPDPSAEPQAAIAPTLAPEPPQEVVAAPEPLPTRAPVTRLTPRPTPSARPTTRPTPKPTTRGGGSRIGDDFLEGTGGSERSNARGTPAATFGPAEQASLQQAINRQLKPHWSAPQGVDAEKLVTVVRWEMNSDGSLKGRPSCISQSGETPSNAAQKALHCERAIRAIQLAAPFELPEEFYDKWKRATWRFDRRL